MVIRRAKGKEEPPIENPVRLLILNTMLVTDVQRVPGVVVDEALRLGESLDEVHVLFFHPVSTLDWQLARNVFVHTVPYAKRDTFLRGAVAMVKAWFLMVVRGSRLVTQYGLSVVRSDDAVLTGVPGWGISVTARVPLVVFVAGSVSAILQEKMKTRKDNPLLRWAIQVCVNCIERAVLRRAVWVLAVTPPLLAVSRRRGARRIAWSSTFLDLSQYSPRPLAVHSPFRVLYVGRLEPEKGVMILLEAARQLDPRHFSFRLVGDGSLRSVVSLMAQQDALHHVEVLGSRPHGDLPRFYEECDLLVLPSYTEGIPVAVLEAMALGRPVVVTRVGIVPFLFLDRKHAMLIELGDPAGLVDAIKTVAASETTLLRLVEGGLDLIASRFARYLDQHILVYRQASRRGARP